jgi:hypothetical protein
MRSMRSGPAACSLCVLTFAAPAIAQDAAAAAALFDRGLAEMDAGRTDTGCPLLAESRRLDPRAGTVFTLAECEAKRGRVAAAVRLYDDYLSLFARMPLSEQAKQGERARIASEQTAALTPRIPRLTLRLAPGAPSQTVVKRDDEVIPPALLGVAQALDPGEHVIVAELPGGKAARIRITLAPGEIKQLELDPRARGDEPRDEAPTRPEEQMRRRSPRLMIGGIVTMGVGFFPLLASPFVYLFGCATNNGPNGDTTFKAHCPGPSTAAIAMAITGGVLMIGGAVLAGVGGSKVRAPTPARAAWIPVTSGSPAGSLRWVF